MLKDFAGRKTLRSFVAIVALGLLSPCAGRAQEVIELPLSDRALSVRAEELHRVGAIDGEDWEVFSAVSGVAFDAEGNLYILDRQNFRVVKVDSQGGFLAQMGRAGEGPGELGMPLAMSVTREGETRIFDLAKRGFAVFHPDGTFDRTVPLPAGQTYLPSGALLSHPDGGLVDGGTGGMTLRVSSSGGTGTPGRLQVKYLTLGDEVEIAGVYDAWNPAPATSRRAQVSTGGSVRVSGPAQRAFDPELLTGILPDGRIAVTDSTTYEVKLVTLGSGVTRRITRPFSPRPVTRKDEEEERERQLAEIRRRTASGGGESIYATGGDVPRSGRIPSSAITGMLEERIRGMEFGEEIPVLSGLSVDWEGRIWIERTGPRVGELGCIDVLSAEGRYLGTLGPEEFSLPGAFGPGGLAAWIERDELDVPQVVVKRLSVG